MYLLLVVNIEKALAIDDTKYVSSYVDEIVKNEDEQKKIFSLIVDKARKNFLWFNIPKEIRREWNNYLILKKLLHIFPP